MAYPSKKARNAALFADYRKGYLRRHLCSKYGLSESGLASLLARHSVTLPENERLRRSTEGRRKASYRNVGRKPAWRDCPADLIADYKLLARYMPAAEARAVLEAAA